MYCRSPTPRAAIPSSKPAFSPPSVLHWFCASHTVTHCQYIELPLGCCYCGFPSRCFQVILVLLSIISCTLGIMTSSFVITLAAVCFGAVAADPAGYVLPSTGSASTTQFYAGPEFSGGTSCGVSGLPNGQSTSGMQGGGPGYLYVSFFPLNTYATNGNQILGGNQSIGFWCEPFGVWCWRTRRGVRYVLLDHAGFCRRHRLKRKCSHLQNHRRVSRFRGS